METAEVRKAESYKYWTVRVVSTAKAEWSQEEPAKKSRTVHWVHAYRKVEELMQVKKWSGRESLQNSRNYCYFKYNNIEHVQNYYHESYEYIH